MSADRVRKISVMLRRCGVGQTLAWLQSEARHDAEWSLLAAELERLVTTALGLSGTTVLDHLRSSDSREALRVAAAAIEIWSTRETTKV